MISAYSTRMGRRRTSLGGGKGLLGSPLVLERKTLSGQFLEENDDAVAQAGEEGADGDHGGDADDDAQDGEQGAETVVPDGRKGHGQVFAQVICIVHSLLKAAMGPDGRAHGRIGAGDDSHGAGNDQR